MKPFDKPYNKTMFWYYARNAFLLWMWPQVSFEIKKISLLNWLRTAFMQKLLLLKSRDKHRTDKTDPAHALKFEKNKTKQKIMS